EGAAIAWTSRVTLDALALFIMAKRSLPDLVPLHVRTSIPITLGLIVLILATIPQEFALKVVFLLLTILAFSFVAWFRLLSPDERKLAQNFINGRILVQTTGPIRA